MIIGDLYIQLPTSLPQLDVTSIYFVLFALMVFFLSRPFKSFLRPYIVFIANIAFIYSFSPEALIYVSLASLISYAFSFLLNKYKKAWVLAFSIIPFVLLLVYFKYAGIITNNSSIIIPLGMSFYSFKIISYLVDIYRGTTTIEKNPLYYFDYVMFFPCITAGPINRADHFISTLRSKQEFSYKQAKGGGFQMMLGIFEKVVLCDFVASVVSMINGNIELSGINTLLGVVLYSFQIYLDFDAISNIAIGCARLLGFNLGKNFNSPYLAKNLSDFWKRWHISLSTWLKDYIYIPLGGNRKGQLRKYLNLLIVFVVSGLWHGSTWNFLLWGVLHAVVQIIEDLILRPFKDKQYSKTVSTLLSFFGVLINFVIVTFLWLIFRYQTLGEVANVIKLIGMKQSFSYELIGLTRNEFIWLIIVIIIVIVFDILRNKMNMIKAFNKWPFICRWLSYAVLVVVFLVFGMYGGSFEATDFIYRFF